MGLLVQLARPHQAVHQLALILVLSGFYAAPKSRVVLAMVIALLATLCLMLAGDLRHRRDDDRAGRRRLVHVVGTRATAAALSVGLSVVIALSLVLGGWACGCLVAATMAATALYNGAKARRRPFLAAVGRALAGGTLAGVYAIWFEAPSSMVWLAIVSALLDLGGNLAGDLRDLVVDRRASLRTVPIILGARATTVLMMGCTLMAAVAAVPLVIRPTWLVAAAITGVLAAAVTTRVPARWAHAAMHGPKLAQWMLIGASVMPVAPAAVIGHSAIVGGLWSAAMWAYVNSIAPVEGPGA